ncbi:MATE family efflux transporter, partial [Planctomycetota bacterium]
MSNELDMPLPLHRPGGVRQLLHIALPMVVSQACETAMMFVDRLFLAKLGPQFMSASMGGGLTVFMFMTFFVGLIGYATPLAAQYLGAGRKEYCARAVFQAIIIAVLAYPVILLCIPAGHMIFRTFQIAPEQLAPQKEYFNIMMYSAIIWLLRHAATTFFSGIGRTRIVMASAVAAMTVNVAANYVLIFGKLG